MIIKGIIQFRGKTLFDKTKGYKGKGEERIRFTITEVEYISETDDLPEFDLNDRFTPIWYKDFSSGIAPTNINLSTLFEFPIIDSKGREIDFTELGKGSKVLLETKTIGEFIYPKCIVVLQCKEPKTDTINIEKFKNLL